MKFSSLIISIGFIATEIRNFDFFSDFMNDSFAMNAYLNEDYNY